MRIALVNDLPLAIEALRRALAQAPQHAVAWTAANGAEAVELCRRDRPDLVLMDLTMPVMDGIEATRRIMAAAPCPILIVTADVENSTRAVFDALGAGALDAVNTPTLEPTGTGVRALLAKIDVLGKLVVAPAGSAAPFGVAARRVEVRADPAWLWALGASAGGPAAIVEVLKEFSSPLPAAIVIVQHVDAHFALGLAEWLRRQLALPVQLASEGDRPAAGTVLLAARADHLVLRADGTLGYTVEPANCFYRPSVDVFFGSVVEHWHGQAAGVLLTGMGRDGARGLKRMRDARFRTIAQDQASSAVFGMPKAAIDLDAAGEILPLAQIGAALRRLVSRASTSPA